MDTQGEISAVATAIENVARAANRDLQEHEARELARAAIRAIDNFRAARWAK